MRSGSRLSGSDPSAPATKPLSERNRRRWGSCLVCIDCWRIATEHGIGTIPGQLHDWHDWHDWHDGCVTDSRCRWVRCKPRGYGRD